MAYTEKFVEYLKKADATEKNMKRQIGKIFKFKKGNDNVTVKIYKEKEEDKRLNGKIYINDELVFETTAFTTKKEGSIESITSSILDALKFIFRDEKVEVKKEEVKSKVKPELSDEQKAMAISTIIKGLSVVRDQLSKTQKVFDSMAELIDALK